MSGQTNQEPFESWQDHALELLIQRNYNSLDSPSELSTSEEALLLAFVQEDITTEIASQIELLIQKDPAILRHLDRIQQIQVEIEKTPVSDPKLMWNRLQAGDVHTKPVVSTIARPLDLLVNFLEQGIQLISTSGSEFYAPATVRSSETTQKNSLSLEFLTSIGTIRLIIDYVSENQFHLSVVAHRILNQYPLEQLKLSLNHTQLQTSSDHQFIEGRIRILNLSPGNYSLIITQDKKELATILCQIGNIPDTLENNE